MEDVCDGVEVRVGIDDGPVDQGRYLLRIRIIPPNINPQTTSPGISEVIKAGQKVNLNLGGLGEKKKERTLALIAALIEALARLAQYSLSIQAGIARSYSIRDRARKYPTQPEHYTISARAFIFYCERM
jgi:hypothetical protein